MSVVTSMTTIELSDAKPPDLELVANGLASPASSFPADSPGGEMGGAAEEGQAEDVSSAYEKEALAALLGLHSACLPEASSPDDGSHEDDEAAPTGADMEERGRWGDLDAKRWPQLSGQGYSSPGDASPKAFRTIDYDTPGQGSPKRQRNPKDGAPPPGTSRFRCRFPGCKKLYASTDAVRKHCRKRHLEWLRRIDLVSAHERGLPKPALYCVWGDEDEEE